MTDSRTFLIKTSMVVMVTALFMVYQADDAGAPVALAYGWGVDGVAEMASHVHSDGWSLGKDQVEQDTGYYLFASLSPRGLLRSIHAFHFECMLM